MKVITMAEQEQKKPATTGRPTWHGNRYRRGNQVRRGNYKSRLEGLGDDFFDIGASSNPAKFSKSLKNIETCIQKIYKSPDDIVKALQQMG
jgi:hypothetical protein